MTRFYGCLSSCLLDVMFSAHESCPLFSGSAGSTRVNSHEAFAVAG
jgi:hypothetical protein